MQKVANDERKYPRCSGSCRGIRSHHGDVAYSSEGTSREDAEAEVPQPVVSNLLQLTLQKRTFQKHQRLIA